MEHSNISWQSDPAWSSRSAWRDQYYIADLYSMFDLAWGLGEIGGSRMTGNHLPTPSVHAVICPRPSVPNTNEDGNLSFSPTSLASQTSRSTTLGRETDSSNTSPTIFSQMSSSSNSPVSKDPNPEADSFCHPCGQGFTGSPQNRRSNMLRHLKGTIRHNSDAGLRCPQQPCESTKPMRSDNLRQHLQRIHGISSRKELQDAVERSKQMKAPRFGRF